MIKRSITGIVLICLVVWALYSSTYKAFELATLILTLAMGLEWASLIKISKRFYKLLYIALLA